MSLSPLSWVSKWLMELSVQFCDRRKIFNSTAIAKQLSYSKGRVRACSVKITLSDLAKEETKDGEES